MPDLYPGVTYPGEADAYPGGTTFPGSDIPVIEVLYSTDNATDTDPSWTYVPASEFMGYSVDRGRETELEEIDAGTCSIHLRNHERDWDPSHNASIRPMNRWQVRTKFQGVTQSRFVGWADAYDLSWPEAGKDSRVTVRCSDEQKILNLSKLPTMNPPRDTYTDLVMFDEPHGYWRMDDEFDTTLQATAAAGDPLTATNTDLASIPVTGIVGNQGSSLWLGPTNAMTSPEVVANSTFDISNLDSFTFEAWLAFGDSTPSAQHNIAGGPAAGAVVTWRLDLNTDGTLSAAIRQGGVTYTATTPAMFSTPAWYHVVVTVTGAGLLIYVNGAQVAVASRSGTFGAIDAGAQMTLGNTAGATDVSYDEVAFWRRGMAADRIAAHYTAGALRGFPVQDSDERVSAVLDAAGSTAPRLIYAGGSREMLAAFMHGQSALDEIRAAENADNVDAVFFVSREGVVTFLGAIHRLSPPWDVASITAFFDDDGTNLPYLKDGLATDYSESFLANVWHVTRDGGVTQTNSDATSIGKYRERAQSLTGVSVTTDGAANSISAQLLAKYKDPLHRVTALKPSMTDLDTAVEVLGLDIGIPVNVSRRPVGGGSPISQISWIQKISESGKPGEPLDVTLSVSPV